jgi:hypothetical protein
MLFHKAEQLINGTGLHLSVRVEEKHIPPGAHRESLVIRTREPDVRLILNQAGSRELVPHHHRGPIRGRVVYDDDFNLPWAIETSVDGAQALGEKLSRIPAHDHNGQVHETGGMRAHL